LVFIPFLPPADQILDIGKYVGILVGGLLGVGYLTYYLSTIMD